MFENRSRGLLGQDGGDAATQHELDRGPVPQEGCGHPLRVQEDAHVHLCLCILSREEQSEPAIRGEGPFF